MPEIFPGEGEVVHPATSADSCHDPAAITPDMTDKHKAFHLSIVLCCIDEVKKNEPARTKEGIRRLKALKRLEAEIVRITNMYLPKKGFDYDDMRKAEHIVDLVNEKIVEFYPAEVRN